MNDITLKYTKNRLAIIFTLIVFFIAFFLELTYFSFRYYNFTYNDKRNFNNITNQIFSQIQKDPNFFNIFITEGIKFKPPINGDFQRGRGGDFRFLNFLVLDNSGNILAQNIGDDLEININNYSGLKYNSQPKLSNGTFIKKIDISNFGDNFGDLILFKKQGYATENYLEDLFFSLLLNIIFSILFYFIGLFFVGKNLKPIEQTLSDMNDFIHNANHELKTPISVISSNLQLIKTTKSYEEDLILLSIKELNRINQLIEGLSSLSDINPITGVIELNISKEITEIIQELKGEIEKKEIILKQNILSNFKLKANKQYFYIVFSNLLRNAIKYNFQKGEINITLSKNKLIISNSGDGISKEDLPNIFDRFFKGEKGRSTEGFGIGLSLVKKICDIYNRKINVQSDEKETSFEINF
ncbi:MAG: HAMP domain-containing sensor histidine kinase [Candidatus Gracilibacteria bacterium]|nr:HAMP domain-containing sensor histidine kinase [Candidatus Gracilibacteria bacterium]